MPSGGSIRAVCGEGVPAWLHNIARGIELAYLHSTAGREGVPTVGGRMDACTDVQCSSAGVRGREHPQSIFDVARMV